MKTFLILLTLFASIGITSCCSSRHGNRESAMNTKQDTIASSTGKNALDLTPVIEIKSDSLVIFSLDAVRNFIVEDEYIPSSEVLRVIIMSEKGAEVWNSGKDQVFMQVITSVFPSQPGEKYRYSVEWNGRRNNGAMLSPGKYTVVMTIPAKPRPYSVTTDFDWKK